MASLQVLKSSADQECIRVFLAEGSASDVFWLEMVFKGSRIPYNIEIAGDGQTAKNYLEQLTENGTPAPDLILFDVNVPGAPPLEVLDDFAAHSRVPFFVLVESNIPSRAGHSRRYLQKPFTQSQLQACLAARSASGMKNLPGMS